MKPTIIEGPLPSQAVEEWRRRHHGFLPTEEREWVVSFITAIKANLVKFVREQEFDELQVLALKGIESEARISSLEQVAGEALRGWERNTPYGLHSEHEIIAALRAKVKGGG